MLIDLHELLQEADGVRKYHVSYEKSCFKTKGMSCPVKRNTFRFSFQNQGKKHVSFQCDGSMVLEMPCDRCLEPVEQTINIDYFKDLDFNKTQEEKIAELDEEIYLDGTIFDSEVFIENEVLVNLPMKVLCSPDCKGICNRCGANLNLGSCKCNNAELDPRMSKILDVFHQFKEV